MMKQTAWSARAAIFLAALATVGHAAAGGAEKPLPLPFPIAEARAGCARMFGLQGAQASGEKRGQAAEDKEAQEAPVTFCKWMGGTAQCRKEESDE